MTPGQQGSLAERRSASLAELVGAPGRRVLVIGASKDPNPKVTVVLFEGDKEPVRAIKVPLTEVAAASVMTERRVLTEIAGAIGDTPVAGTIPRVLGDAVFEGRTALVCSGRSITGGAIHPVLEPFVRTSQRRPNGSKDFKPSRAPRTPP